MKLPNYYHIGVMKTGTTYLQEILGQDERIQLFNHSRILNTNAYYYSEYRDLDPSKFSIESDENIVDTKGSLCGLYTSLLRISKHNPSATIILTIRDQKKLLLSGYKHTIRQTDENFSFIEFLDSHYGMNYLNGTDYYSIIKLIEKFFPKENIRVIPYEFIKEKKFIERFYRDVFQLDPPDLNQKNKVINQGLVDPLIKFKRFLNTCLIFNRNSILGVLERKAHSLLLKVVDKLYASKKPVKTIHWPENSQLCQKLEEQFRMGNFNLENEYELGLKSLGYLFP